jgi:hypothetical protein
MTKSRSELSNIDYWDDYNGYYGYSRQSLSLWGRIRARIRRWLRRGRGWQPPKTWVKGEAVSAATMNTNFTENLNRIESL